MRPSRWKCLGVWLVPPFPSGFRPRIRVRGMLSIRRHDEFGGGNHSSRIGVRDMLSCQAQSFRLATISSMAARMVRVLSRDSGSS